MKKLVIFHIYALPQLYVKVGPLSWKNFLDPRLLVYIMDSPSMSESVCRRFYLQFTMNRPLYMYIIMVFSFAIQVFSAG